MGHSLMGITYDLLAFHGAGTDGLYERCFEKATRYLSCSLSDEPTRKLRRWGYQFLRATGYIDVVRSQRKWAISAPALVQAEESKFILLGGSRERETIRNNVSSRRLREVQSTYRHSSLAPEISFFPEIIEVTATTSEAIQIAHESGIQVSLHYQDLLFSKLPSVNSILESVLFKVITAPIFEPNSAQYLNLTKKEWTPYAGMFPDKAGLYRKDSKFAAPSYYLSIQETELEVFLVADREWAIICFCALFDHKLPIKYKVKEGRLCIDSRGFEELRLPTLIERCLRSGTLREPLLTEHGMVHENVKYANLWKLMSKFPIFSLEQI